MRAAERNAMRSLRNARKDRVYRALCEEDSSGERKTHIEKRLLPRSQYFLGQDRELITFRSRGVVTVVTDVAVVIHVEVKKFAIVFLDVLVKFGIFLCKFR